MKTYRSFSSEETKYFSEQLARAFLKSPAKGKRRGATVFALKGNLGAGKTTFVQGFFRGLGLKRAASPTFIIMRRYSLKRGIFKNVYHMDAYRLKKTKELKVLEFGEILADPQNIVLIEWPERIKNILPKNVKWIIFKHGKKEDERIIIYK